MSSHCKINIKPTITVGRITTIAESIIPKLFDGENIVLQSESIINDKKKFFKIRMELAKVLTPIVETIIHEKKEVILGLQLLDSGKLKIFQLKDMNCEIPESVDDDIM